MELILSDFLLLRARSSSPASARRELLADMLPTLSCFTSARLTPLKVVRFWWLANLLWSFNFFGWIGLMISLFCSSCLIGESLNFVNLLKFLGVWDKPLITNCKSLALWYLFSFFLSSFIAITSSSNCWRCSNYFFCCFSVCFCMYAIW